MYVVGFELYLRITLMVNDTPIHKYIQDTVSQLAPSPVLEMKAVKNSAEEQGMIEAHILDAVAVCDWAAYMEAQIMVEMVDSWTEIRFELTFNKIVLFTSDFRAAELLSDYRKEQMFCKSDSFGTISAYGANGAIIHYSATPETDTRQG